MEVRAILQHIVPSYVLVETRLDGCIKSLTRAAIKVGSEQETSPVLAASCSVSCIDPRRMLYLQARWE